MITLITLDNPNKPPSITFVKLNNKHIQTKRNTKYILSVYIYGGLVKVYRNILMIFGVCFPGTNDYVNLTLPLNLTRKLPAFAEQDLGKVVACVLDALPAWAGDSLSLSIYIYITDFLMRSVLVIHTYMLLNTSNKFYYNYYVIDCLACLN